MPSQDSRADIQQGGKSKRYSTQRQRNTQDTSEQGMGEMERFVQIFMKSCLLMRYTTV